MDQTKILITFLISYSFPDCIESKRRTKTVKIPISYQSPLLSILINTSKKKSRLVLRHSFNLVTGVDIQNTIK